MTMIAQMTYRSLYSITERRPEYRSLSIVAVNGSRPTSDRTDVPPRACPVVLMAGPDSDDPMTTDGIRPRWLL
jgi:hypothetical protein